MYLVLKIDFTFWNAEMKDLLDVYLIFTSCAFYRSGLEERGVLRMTYKERKLPVLHIWRHPPQR